MSIEEEGQTKMSSSSYDDLIDKIENLEAENKCLRKELADNSLHLNKLECEASNIKGAFMHLAHNNAYATNGPPVRVNGLNNSNLDSNCNQQAFPNRNEVLLQQLLNDKTRIIHEIRSAQNEKKLYHEKLEIINEKLQEIPNSNNTESEKVHLQQQHILIRNRIYQKLGTENEMKRQESRLHHLLLIDEQISKLMLNKNNQKLYNNLEMAEETKGSMQSSYTSNNDANDRFSLYGASNIQMSAFKPVNDSNSNVFGGYHGIPVDRALWHSGPSSVGGYDSLNNYVFQETSTMTNFNCTMASSMSTRKTSIQQLGAKMEMVYSLLSMLGARNKDDMSKTLLAMSTSPDSCIAMRQSGCLPLLVQLLHGGDKDSLVGDTRGSLEARRHASLAMHNIVHAHPDDKRGRREARVLRLLELIREYCDILRDSQNATSEDERRDILLNTLEKHPGPSIAALMKLSFDEENRHAMCQLGGLQAIAELIEVDNAVHDNTNNLQHVTLRRFAGMALTNLTFGDGTNKALLCGMKSFMNALIAQLHSPNEDLRQVTASVLRNLSWRADPASKKTLREVGTVPTLIKAAMEAKNEHTLKSILSALWNLTSHCSINKSDICAVDGALAFLVSTLTYKSTLKTLAIVENGGGILRNISSHIAIHEKYRNELRVHNCLQILLQHLKSPSLTIVSNACGTLWNLSARSSIDQDALIEMGAVNMLKNLVHSKHKMISMGSAAALKNLLASKPAGLASCLGPSSKSDVPALHFRKQKALEAELDQNLSETCDNIESPKSSPTAKSDDEQKFTFSACASPHSGRLLDRQMMNSRMYHSVGSGGHSLPRDDFKVSRSSSRGCIESRRLHPSEGRHRSLDQLHRSIRIGHNGRNQSPSPARKLTNGKMHSSQQDLLDVNNLSNFSYLNDSQQSSQMYSDRASPPKPKINNYMPPSRKIKSEKHDYSPSQFNNNVSENGLIKGTDENNKPLKYVAKYKSSPTCVQESDAVRRSSSLNTFKCEFTESDDESHKPMRIKENISKNQKEANNHKEENSSHSSYDCDEFPRTYCVEDTPAVFSRASPVNFSYQDLIENSNGVQEDVKAEVEESEHYDEQPTSYCIEDTPAVFSRASPVHFTYEDLLENGNGAHKDENSSNDVEICNRYEERPSEYCVEGTPGVLSRASPTDFTYRELPERDTGHQKNSEDADTSNNYDEQPKMYCVEDTPAVFSRASPVHFTIGELMANGRMSSDSTPDNLEKSNEEDQDDYEVGAAFSRSSPLNVGAESPTGCPRTYNVEDTPAVFSRASPVNVTMQDLISGNENNDQPEETSEYNYDDCPQIYCVEGTPGVFSRASPLPAEFSGAKLKAANTSSAPRNQRNDEEDYNSDGEPNYNGRNVSKSDDTNIDTSNSAMITPLMYSRSSSPEMLNDSEVPSIHESSSVGTVASCDVSLGEMDDSISQRASPTYPIRNGMKDLSNESIKPSPVVDQNNSDIFEDRTISFQYEGSTKVLTNKSSQDINKENVKGVKNSAGHKDDRISPEKMLEKKDSNDLSDDNDDEENMLAELISSGMPVSRKVQAKFRNGSHGLKSLNFNRSFVGNDNLISISDNSKIPKKSDRLQFKNATKPFSNNCSVTLLNEQMDNLGLEDDRSSGAKEPGKKLTETNDWRNELLDSGPTPDEQELLYECINSAYPKAKNSSKCPSPPRHMRSRLPTRTSPTKVKEEQSVDSSISEKMTSSSISEKKKIRFLPLPKQRILGHNRDIMKCSGGSDLLENVRPPSNMGSIDNLSMMSSCCSENINDINPPSVMDDISGVSYSVGNLGLGAAERKKKQNVFNDQTVNGCMKSSCSELLENMKPPSSFQDISELNTEDFSYKHDDSCEYDTEVEEDLPHDEDHSNSKATDSSHDADSQRCATAVGFDDRCGTALSWDFAPNGDHNKEIAASSDSGDEEFEIIDESDVEAEITSDQIKFLEADANLVVSSLNNLTNEFHSSDQNLNENLINVPLIEDETISLLSIESESERVQERQIRIPRIVKPVNRVASQTPETVEQNQPKSIRGRRKALYSKPRASSANSYPHTVAKQNRSISSNAVRGTKSSPKSVTRNQNGSLACNSRIQNPRSRPITSPPKWSTFKADNEQKRVDSRLPNPPVKHGTFTRDSSKSKTNSKVNHNGTPPLKENTSVINTPMNGSRSSVKSTANKGKIVYTAARKTRKEVKSRVAEMWKKDASSPKSTNGHKSAPPSSKLTRSSTYEKIPEISDEAKVTVTPPPKKQTPKAKKPPVRAPWQSCVTTRPSVIKKPNVYNSPSLDRPGYHPTNTKTSQSDNNILCHTTNNKTDDEEDGSSTTSSDSADVAPINTAPASKETHHVAHAPTNTSANSDMPTAYNSNTRENAISAEVPLKTTLPKRFCLITNI